MHVFAFKQFHQLKYSFLLWLMYLFYFVISTTITSLLHLYLSMLNRLVQNYKLICVRSGY